METPAGNEGVTFTRILVGPFKDDVGSYGGIFWGDYDSDTYMDLLVTGVNPRLYRNEGNGNFTRIVDGGLADYVSLCRPLIREPDLVRRWQAGDRRQAECLSYNGCVLAGVQGQGVHCPHLGA